MHGGIVHIKINKMHLENRVDFHLICLRVCFEEFVWLITA